ncbi:hypothetical protein D3C85_1230360 [compost metagenome]
MARRFIHQQLNRAANEGAGGLQCLDNWRNTILQRNILGSGHQKTKRHRLRVAVGESFVAGLREQHNAPVSREILELLRTKLQLFRYLVAKQAAKAR